MTCAQTHNYAFIYTIYTNTHTHKSTYANTHFTHTNVHAKHNQLSQNPLTGFTTELEKFDLSLCLFVAIVSSF